MSIDRRDSHEGFQDRSGALLARATAAERRSEDRLATVIEDFFLSADARLDDRTRTAMTDLLEALTVSIESALRQHAARLLVARKLPEIALPLAQASVGSGTLDRMVTAGLLRDVPFMREVFGRVRHDLLAEALPIEAPVQQEQASLLPRLAAQADAVVATSAVALLAAESRRHAALSERPGGADLPAEMHHRLVWWVAAVLREDLATRSAAGDMALDRALADAALRHIGAYDEGERLEAAAMRLAVALDPGADELSALLIEALGDRRLSLFVALLGHVLGLDFADAREIVLDPDADRLWLVLRALELDRPSIARIGLALSEADPNRDIERFADDLDGIVAVAPTSARDILAPLMLHADYRAALSALARGRAHRTRA